MRTVLRLVLPSAVVSFLLVAALGGALFLKIIPDLERENEERVTTLPRFLALLNQQAILRRDLAALQGNLDGILANAKRDLLYAYFLDARGEVLAQAYHKEVGAEERAAIEAALKSMGREEAKNSNSRVAQIAGLAEATGETTAADPGGAFLPISGNRTTKRVAAGEILFTDVAEPISVAARAFGGVRVGFRDDLTDRIRGLRVAFGVFSAVLFLVLVGGSWMLGGGIAEEVDVEIQGRVAGERRRIEEDFAKRLRSVEAKQEEDSPLSATEFFALLDTAKRLQQSLDYNEILSLTVQATLQALDVRDMSLFLLDPEHNELYGRAGYDESGEIHAEEMSRIRIPVGQGDLGLAAEFGTTAVIDNPKPGSAVVAALVARGKVLGVILARNKVSGRPMLKKDALVLRQLSALVAGALENAALYHQALLTGSAGGGHTGVTPN